MGADDELFAQIAADPDSPAPYLVLSDALQQRGDPRGELIAVQHALETATAAQAGDLRRREGDALLANADAWIGIGPGPRKGLVVRWRFGFIHAARVMLDGDSLAALRALLAAPAIDSTLAELRLGPVRERSEAFAWPELAPMLELLRSRWPRALRRLYLNEGDLHGLRRAPAVEIAGLRALDTLVVQSRSITIRELPPVRRLELRTPDFALATLPAASAIEELVIWSRKPGPLDPLSPQRFPGLRRLALVGTQQTDQLVARLVELPIVHQLVELDLTGGTLTTNGLPPLRSFAKRGKLVLAQNLIEKLPRGFPRSPQRAGEKSWLDARELAHLAKKIVHITTPRRDSLKFYRDAIAAAARVDPSWAYERRMRLARGLERESKCELSSELAREWERELAVEIPKFGAELYRSIAGTYDTLGDMIAAEAWMWQAVHAARWYEQSDEEQLANGQLATLRMRRGDSAGAAPALARLAGQYKARGATDHEAWALRQQGNAEATRSNFALAEGFYLRALELYRARADRDNESIVLSELSSVFWSRGDFAGAEKVLREALTLRDPTSVGVGSTYYNLGAILNGASRIPEAIEAVQQSLAVFRRHRHRAGEGQALSLMGELLQRTNEHAKAHAMLEEALACHRAVGAKPQAGITLGNLSRVANDLGDYERAREYCEEAIELHREVGNKYNEGLQLMGIADALIGMRQLSEANGFLEQALVPLRAIKSGPGISAVYLRQGIVAHLAGDPSAARQHYDRSIAEAKRARYDEMIGWCELWIAILHAHEPALARQILDGARDKIPKHDVQGKAALAMTEVVLARFAGARSELPTPLSWDERILASLVS